MHLKETHRRVTNPFCTLRTKNKLSLRTLHNFTYRRTILLYNVMQNVQPLAFGKVHSSILFTRVANTIRKLQIFCYFCHGKKLLQE